MTQLLKHPDVLAVAAKDWKTLSNLEIALACAVSMRVTEFTIEGQRLRIKHLGRWAYFDPIKNDADALKILRGVKIVVGSHEHEEDDAAGNTTIKRWYSGHGFYSGVKTEGFKLENVICHLGYLLLKHDLLYHSDH